MYRRTWAPIAGAILLVGVAVACTCLGGGPVLFCGMIGLISAAVPFERYCAHHGLERGELRAVGGVLCGTTLLGLLGLATAAGALGWWVGVLLVFASWPVVRRPRAHGNAGRGAAQFRTAGDACGPPTEWIARSPLHAPATVPALSTEELCWTWRVSYIRLPHAGDANERDALTRLRAALLDELERRDPAAFNRWLPTARAAGDPAPFFHSRDRTDTDPGAGTEHPAAEEAGSD